MGPRLFLMDRDPMPSMNHAPRVPALRSVQPQGRPWQVE